MDRPIQALRPRRRHLFEWEDQPWLPSSLRNIVTDHLRHVFASERAASLRETVVDVLEGPLRPSRDAAHHSGSGRMASPYPMGDFHLLFFASFLAHSESGHNPT